MRTTLLLALLCIGCSGGSSDSTPLPQNENAGRSATELPPSQVRSALDGLKSTKPADQMRGILLVEKFPELKERHRDLLKHLSENGSTPAVKKRAKESLQ